MFGSNVLETAIGLIFVYLGFSLVCSGFREWIAVILNTRARTLKKGILNMLKDETRMSQIFNHHLVRVKQDDGSGEKGAAPKYISSKAFAQALLESILKAQKDEKIAPEGSSTPPAGAEKKAVIIEGMRKSIAKIENPQVKNMLLGMLESTEKRTAGWEEKCENAKKVIEDWFNDEMELLSAWYKRQTHKVLLLLAVIFCIVFNVDTIMITRTLSVDSALQQSVKNAVVQTVNEPIDSTSVDSYKQGKEIQAQIQQLGIPIGWTSTPASDLAPRGIPQDFLAWFYKVIGILMSILAVSLGAPFWFDVLKKMITLTTKPKNQDAAPASAQAVPAVLLTAAPVPSATAPAPPCPPVGSI
ncbi:MAG TPA: hypothetical protein VK186_03105 [Candidatus Deferrimicrobium sp.]|nr:hypothetical protein [Candidatus Deferrimicrobium sp.]